MRFADRHPVLFACLFVTALVASVMFLSPLVFRWMSGEQAFAATEAANFKWEVGISGYVVSNPTTATTLTVPSTAIHATFTVSSGALCVSKGIAAPTPTNSERWPAGFIAEVNNDGPMLRRMRVINCDNGTPATVQVYFRRQWQAGDSQ